MADASVVTQGHLWDPWGGNLIQTVSLGALPSADDCWLSQELRVTGCVGQAAGRECVGTQER